MVEVVGAGIPLVASAGFEQRALTLAARAEAALAWHAERLGWMPTLRLAVADEHDWAEVAPVPIYGVPQTFGERTIMAADLAPLHRDLAELIAVPPDDVLPFFDAFVAHEVVHLFGEQEGQREAPLWAVELWCNLGMVGYLRDADPDGLDAIRAEAAAMAAVPLSTFAGTALADMERSVEAGPLDFGWYVVSLTRMADDLWDAAGPELYPALYDLLRPDAGDHAPVTAEDLVALSPAVAVAMERWPG
jgi:hypothetical protein